MVLFARWEIGLGKVIILHTEHEFSIFQPSISAVSRRVVHVWKCASIFLIRVQYSIPGVKIDDFHSSVKVMILSFFDSQGFLPHHEFPQCQTITNCVASFQEKNGRKGTSKKMLLHHDNLSPQGAAQKSQPLYSPNLAPCDFWLFPEVTKAAEA